MEIFQYTPSNLCEFPSTIYVKILRNLGILLKRNNEVHHSSVMINKQTLANQTKTKDLYKVGCLWWLHGICQSFMFYVFQICSKLGKFISKQKISSLYHIYQITWEQNQSVQIIGWSKTTRILSIIFMRSVIL